MPRVLKEADIDPIAEQVDLDMMETGEEVVPPVHKFDPEARMDLSDGGSLGGVRVVPVGEKSGRVTFDKAKRERGRPTTRMAWTWEGRPTELPLAWDPSGKQHDGARHYLMKRHCAVCNYSGFYGSRCPACEKADRPSQPGGITPAYYLKRSQVPDPANPFGSVNCFVQNCVRRGQWGFHTDVEMRQHAASRHRQEYRAFQDAATASSKTEVDGLRDQVTALMAAIAASRQPAEPQIVQPQKRQRTAGQIAYTERVKARAREKRVTQPA